MRIANIFITIRREIFYLLEMVVFVLALWQMHMIYVCAE